MTSAVLPRRSLLRSAIVVPLLPQIISSVCAGDSKLEKSTSTVERLGKFEFKYMLAACMYGTTSLQEVLPEVVKTGAIAVDIWPKVHGDQLDELGEEKFTQLLKQNQIGLGCITQYKLGPFRNECYHDSR